MPSRRGLICVLVLCARAAGAQTLSPGPLAEAHASLDDDSSCGSCHAEGRKVDGPKCLSCHQPLAAEIRAGAGLHGHSYPGQECERCHVEHIGKKARLVRWPGGAPEKLDHALTGWPLTGAHASLSCAKCHADKTRGGRATFLGKATTCGSCHKDPHEGRFGGTCDSCHKDSAWKDVRIDRFDHGKTRFALVGKHTAVACKGCHGEPAKWRGLEFESCSNCHQDPHAGKFAPSPCASCHDEKGWKQLSGFDTKHPGLRLTEGHAKVACARCHDRGNEKPPSRGTTCVACHKPVHVARFGNDCKPCHESIRWLGLRREIGLQAHEKTPYPLRGKHVEVPCASCHNPKQPVAKRFRAVRFDSCTACHADKHAGEFAARAHGDCAPCHSLEGYTPTRFTVAMHATTAFPLEGKHEAAPCVTCHPSAHPRLDLHVAKKSCADCHANPHGDQFAAEMAQGGCAKCHTTAAWGEAKVDHSTWPLVGAHGRTACARCHGQVKKGVMDRAQFRGVPRACEGCHADPHAGQFRLNQPVRACDGCHTADRFELPAFEHAKMTGFALTGKHAQVACANCHVKERLRNGDEAVRWRLGYHACKACHADPHQEGLER